MNNSSRSEVRRIAAVVALVLTASTLCGARVHAQAPPAATVAQATLAPVEDPDKTNWTIGLGATLNTGNTRTFSLSTNTHLLLKRSEHQLTVDATGIYGLAAVRDATTNEFSGWDPNAGNVFGQVRYDFFLTPNDALVAAVQLRHDRFAGLELRFQGQLGYLRNFVNEEKHRFWAEAGYDLTYDSFFYEPEQLAMMPLLPADQVVHSARVFVGYDNHLDEAVTFLTGAEALFDFQDASNVRLAVISELRSKVGSNFQLSLQHTLRYDGVPPDGKATLDNILVLSLVYSLIDETEPTPEEIAAAAAAEAEAAAAEARAAEARAAEAAAASAAADAAVPTEPAPGDAVAPEAPPEPTPAPAP